MTTTDLPDAMVGAARRAMEAALQLTDSDRVLVLGDDTVGRCAEAFAAAAAACGCDVVSHDLPVASRPVTALPDGLTDLLADVTVVINAIELEGLSELA